MTLHPPCWSINVFLSQTKLNSSLIGDIVNLNFITILNVVVNVISYKIESIVNFCDIYVLFISRTIYVLLLPLVPDYYFGEVANC